MADTLGSSIQKTLIDFLAPLREAAADPNALADLLAMLGQTPAVAADPALLQIMRNAASLVQKLETFDEKDLRSWTGVRSILETADEVAKLQGELRQFAEDPSRIRTTQGLAEEVMSLLLASYLRRRHPILFRTASLLTLIEVRENAQVEPPLIENGVTIRYQRILDRFNFSVIDDLVSNPIATLKKTYFLNDMTTGADAWSASARLFASLSFVADVLRLSWRTEHRPVFAPTPSPDVIEDPIEAQLIRPDPGDGEEVLPPPLPAVTDEYFAQYFPAFRLTVAEPQDNTATEVAVELLASSARHPGAAQGYILAPLGVFDTKITRGSWRLTLSSVGQVPAFLIKSGEFELAPTGLPVSGGVAKILLERLPAENPSEPAVIFGSTSGSRLELGSVSLEGGLLYDPARKAVTLAAKASRCLLIIASGDGDGFLQELLPSEGVKAAFDLALSWSSDRGADFGGAAGLDLTLPISVGGPVTLSAVHLRMQSKDGRVQAEISASIGASIGPVKTAIDRIGLMGSITFPERGGNVGPINVDFDFKPPSGIGLAIEATGVSGGGFLLFDFDKGEYSGAIQLNIEGGITVTAIGIVSTRLPNGEKGFSFVVMITAKGFKPIPLGLGFTLVAIGGLLAINRTCNEEFLREGIKNKTLDSLLFPKDPIRNAPQIFGTLNNAYPPLLGSYLFGPVVRICWGTPPVLTMDLALLLELGKRRRLIILGRVSAILPTEKRDLLRLQMNALGVIDFDQSSISLDAILFDSRLAGKFPITGQMAMRLNWGGSPFFALSIGGFHPAFKSPANFPVLRRLAISLGDSASFRLRAECYIAITSNTLQFGAKLELFAKAGGFSIEGRVGFDVLVQFDPFTFVATFHASVQLKHGSHNLFKVKVEGELSGPRPLHVKGKATFEIFWCDFSVRFDRTLVEGERPAKLAPVNVLEQLVAALKDTRNWSGQIPDNTRRLVILREPPVSEEIVFHPLGTLGVKQKVVPLDLEISRFGNAPPAGARKFGISELKIGDKEVSNTRVKDFFAPSQFLELSDEEKLAAPSFELMNAGLIAGVAGLTFSNKPDDIVESAIKYETIVVDDVQQEKARTEAEPVTIDMEFFKRYVSVGAAARSDLRRSGNAKYRTVAGKYALPKTGWTIVSTEDGTEQAAVAFAAGKVSTYAEAFQAVQNLKASNPGKAKVLMLVRVPVEEKEDV